MLGGEKLKKIYICTFSFVILLIAILVSVQHIYFGIETETFENVILGLISNLLVLIITVFVLDRLFKNHHDRINKEKELNDYKDILSDAHNELVFQIENFIIVFLTKSEAKYKIGKNGTEYHLLELEELKNNIDEYIDKDFLKQKVKLMQQVNSNFDVKEVELSHTDYLIHSKDSILSSINQYILLYSRLMPKNILEKLVEIELMIKKDSIFLVPREMGVFLDLDNQELNEQSIEYFKKRLTLLMDSIIYFKNSIDN